MVTKTLAVVSAACDGACSGNPGPGGWGALLRFSDGSVQEMGGAEADTTNNRMELTGALALLDALAELPRDPALTIRTDSRYLIDGLGRWLPGWKRKGWRTASGSPVLNRDLWERLDRARLPDVPLSYVKGHSGDPDNERCDSIAVAFARGGRPELLAVGGIDLAPRSLQQLLTRLELAERLAQGGHGLSLLELAQLVEQPAARLEQRRDPWIWRDWLVEPLAQGRWRLRRHGGGLLEQV